MALLLKSYMFVPDVYVKVKGLEICKEKKRFVIRLDISKDGVKLPIECSEITIDKNTIVEHCKEEAIKLISVDTLEKAIREQIKNKNTELKAKGLPRITAEKTSKMIKHAVDIEAAKLMREIGETKFNRIFESDLNNIPVVKVAYEYMKSYISDYKTAKDI